MTIYNGTADNDVFIGGGDADTAFGHGGDDTLSGGGDKDVLVGGDGGDTLDGGDGDDQLFSYLRDPNFNGFLGPGVSLDIFAEVDTLTGGAGDDYIFAGIGDSVDGGAHATFGDRLYISFMGATSGVTADFRPLRTQASIVIAGATISNIESVGYLEGSDFDDFLVPIDATYPTGPSVYGRGGNDHIIGDYFTGWAGSGLYGGDGDDIVDARNTVYGPNIYGDAGDDTLYGTTATWAYGGDGNDIIYNAFVTHGGAGNDLIVLGENSSSPGIIYGEDGDDEIRAAANTGMYGAGGAGADVMTGGDGNDYMYSADFIDGGSTPADDVGLEHDVLTGGGGNDNLGAGYGDDVDGGAGTDTLRLSLAGGASGVTFDTAGLAAGITFGGGTIQNIETLSYLLGTAFADTLTLAAQSPSLTADAGDGDDLIYAAHGPVSVIGGNGNDRLVSGGSGNSFDGGAGTDTIDYRDAGNAVTAMLGLAAGQTGSGPGSAQLKNIENIDGSEIFGDLLFGSNDANVLKGLGGNDRLIGRGGNDILDGGTGADIMSGETGDDTYYVDNGGDAATEGLNEGNDIVYASVTWILNSGSFVETLVVADPTGAMILTGNELANTLLGNGAGNVLNGGGGDDVIDGGAGQDVMNGGQGNDLFLVDDTGDQLIEAANEGVDTARTALAAYSLASFAHVENLTGTGALGQQLTGNDGANTIDGGLGDDVMAGGLGNDLYYVDAAGDIVNEAVGAGTDRLLTAISYALAAGQEIEQLEAIAPGAAGAMDLTGNEFANAIVGNAGVNVLRGEGGSDQLTALGGNDILIGGAGSDVMNGGTGDDTYYVDDAGDLATEAAGQGFDRVLAAVSFALAAGSEIELIEAIAPADTVAMDLTGNAFANTINGNDGVNVLRGEGGNDTLRGFAGDDYLIGGTGADNMDGGAGNDVYYVDNLLDQVSEAGGGGNDRIVAAADYALAASAEVEVIETVNQAATNAMNLTGSGGANTIYGNDGANILRGEGGNDVLWGFAGDDYLVGGTGADAMAGGAGNDTYYVDDAADSVSEAAGEGTDRIAASVSYALSVESAVEIIEAVNLTAVVAMDFTGSGGANTLTGNNGVNILRGEGGDDSLSGFGGDDYLVGGTGIDVMNGGTGNDTYYVDNAADVVTESAGQGSDRIAASVSYALSANSEVELIEAASLTATDAINLIGSNGANTIYGNNGVNFLNGAGGNDILWGFGGDDFLTGGTGADFMYGGAGNDTFYVDDSTDRAYEAAGEGNDRIAASVDYALSNDSEIELLEAVSLTATNAMHLTGSDSANIVSGNNGVNILRGEGGNDVLNGYAGDDFLVGGAGVDVMTGGTGNDTYYVDTLADVVIELGGEGSDRVSAAASYALAAEAEIELIEAVTRAAANAMDLTGSDSANTINGNDGVNILRGEGGNDILNGYAGDDVLVGGAGADTMTGSAGNDTYYVDNAADVVVEVGGEGSDRVAAAASFALAATAEIEILEALSQSATDAMNLTGSNSVNTINGNDGANVLDGKGGNDTLRGYGGADIFAFTSALGGSNIDHIADFASGTDKIALDDAIFGAFTANAFVVGAAAQDADDRIVYDSATGRLYFDADGNGAGAAILFAALGGLPTLTAGDFITI